MHDFSFQVVPLNPDQGLDVLETYQVTHHFYAEVKYRQDFEAYCQWYDAVAEQHRQELEAMKSDINILGWFCRP
jgi:hypothetical protein